MAEKIAVKELQSLEQSSGLISLFEIELDATGTNRVRFTRGLDDDLTVVRMKQYESPYTVQDYDVIPAEVSDLEDKSTGPSARPIITIANVLSTFGDALGDLKPENLIGKKFHRRRTLTKYLDGGSGDTNSGVAPIEFPRQTWIIDRIETESSVELSFELTSPFNVEGLVLPYRVVGHNACPWQYQGASPEKAEGNKRGGCTWHSESKYIISGTAYRVYVNADDEYILNGDGGFTTWSGSGTRNSYYKTTTTLGTSSGVRRYLSDGTIDTSADGTTVNNYWQAVRDTTTAPSDTSGDWNRIRIYNDYDAAVTYYAYTDDRYNDYAKPTSGTEFLWQAKITNSGKTQAFGNYWKRGDLCGKRLSSCQCRFGFAPISPGTATSNGKASKDTRRELPFGGFPGARKFK